MTGHVQSVSGRRRMWTSHSTREHVCRRVAEVQPPAAKEHHKSRRLYTHLGSRARMPMANCEDLCWRLCWRQAVARHPAATDDQKPRSLHAHLARRARAAMLNQSLGSHTNTATIWRSLPTSKAILEELTLSGPTGRHPKHRALSRDFVISYYQDASKTLMLRNGLTVHQQHAARSTSVRKSTVDSRLREARCLKFRQTTIDV